IPLVPEDRAPRAELHAREDSERQPEGERPRVPPHLDVELTAEYLRGVDHAATIAFGRGREERVQSRRQRHERGERRLCQRTRVAAVEGYGPGRSEDPRDVRRLSAGEQAKLPRL